MADHNCKTCGTCAKSGIEFKPCNASTYVSAQNGTLFYCPQWTERTDSVEQIALDMYNDCWHMTQFKRERFADRLHALGIEVSK